MYSIIVEERSDLPIKSRKHRRRSSRSASGKGKGKDEDLDVSEVETTNWRRNSGLGQLYRGLGMRISASVIIFMLSIFAADGNESNGWTEL